MYAVIRAGGKQHRVKPGDVLEVELIHRGEDSAVTFTPLLVVDDDGRSHHGKDLGRAVVKATLVGEQKGDKVKVFKYRPKTGYAKAQGHRQLHTLVEINEISLGRKAAPKKAPAKVGGGADAPKETETAAPETPEPETAAE